MKNDSASILSQATPLAQIINLVDLQDRPADNARPAASSLLVEGKSLLHSLRVRLQVCVGEVDLSIGELLGAKEDEVLVLDRSISEPVDLLLQGKVVARGQLMALNGSFAIRVSELPIQLQP